MQKKETKKDALINLSLLFFMKNNTNDKNLIELAAHLIGEIITDHKLLLFPTERLKSVQFWTVFSQY